MSQSPATALSLKVFLSSASMDPAVRERVKKKFDISFVLAEEHIPFLKFPAIHELEERHGVDLGPTYKNRDSALMQMGRLNVYLEP